MGDIQIIQLWINHVNVGDSMEWSLTTEEVLGGTGRSVANVQDRTNSWEPQAHWDVEVIIASSGWVLFKGEIIKEPVSLETGMPWRTWKLDCADYNNELPQRLVGAFDGKTWIDESGFGFFVNIDPFASSLKTDKLTVQQLLDHYIRVDGQAIETTSYVYEYLSEIEPKVEWDYSNLKRALEELASMVVQNLQFWIDPDLKFHWVTIPAWQDLAQEAVAVFEDPSSSSSSMLFPEAIIDGLVVAPYEASDIDGVGDVGFKKLQFDFDGSEMPEQVYVRGGTGYVYNAPSLAGTENKTVVKVPVSGVPGTYKCEIIANNTKTWIVDSTGYTSVTYELAAPGGPWLVKWVVVPWNEARNKGGRYWKFLEGPHTGRMVDDNTNVLNGYGEIEVTFYPDAAVGDPDIGIGGSGWTNEVIQDPTKRQAYLEAPISTTKSQRDAMGGQALYRGQFPTLRGSVEVTGYDGWRAGQLLRITDARLPLALNGRYFVIQRVRASLLPETDVRSYTLDFGDGPTNRYSAQQRGGDDVGWPPPAIQIVISAHDLTPGPNSTQTITGQLVNGLGEPWPITGKVVNWSFECYNNLGVLQTGQGEIKPTVSSTDKNGKARTKLTTGPGTDLVYFVFATVVAT